MSKITEIKETVSGAVEIIRQIRTQGVQESLGKIMDTSMIAKDIIESLKSPEMVKNIENFRVISENMKEVTTKIQSTINHLEETGVIDETKGLIKSAKSVVDSIGGSNQDMREMGTAVKEMFKSIRALVDELRITTIYTKKSGTISNLKETFTEASEIYEMQQVVNGENNKIYSDY